MIHTKAVDWVAPNCTSEYRIVRPSMFSWGLRGLRACRFIRPSERAFELPKPGQVPTKRSGPFSLASAQSCRTASALSFTTGKMVKRNRPTAPVRVTRWGAARVPTVGIRVETGKCASKIARIPVRLSANEPRPYWGMFEGKLGIISSFALSRLGLSLRG